MNKLNEEFLKEYTKLDNYLKKYFSSEKGVTTYIDKMDNLLEKYNVKINGFINDYKKIKNIRWKRNKLAHEDDYMDIDFVIKEDIDFIYDFIGRINCQKDPLSVAEEIKRKSKKISPIKIFFISFLIFIILCVLILIFIK